MTAATPTPDLFLARRAAAGQEDAWDEIIDRFGRKIFNLAFQFAGSREQAEDLTQEIFLRLYQSLRKYNGGAPLVAWALRLSRNLCIDHYRKARRERLAHFVSEETLNQLPADGDPEEHALRRRKIRRVHAALEEMPRDQAEILLLRDIQGWTEQEACAYLEVPAGTVKSRLHRARKALAEQLSTSGSDRREAASS